MSCISLHCVSNLCLWAGKRQREREGSDVLFVGGEEGEKSSVRQGKDHGVGKEKRKGKDWIVNYGSVTSVRISIHFSLPLFPCHSFIQSVLFCQADKTLYPVTSFIPTLVLKDSCPEQEKTIFPFRSWMYMNGPDWLHYRHFISTVIYNYRIQVIPWNHHDFFQSPLQWWWDEEHLSCFFLFVVFQLGSLRAWTPITFPFLILHILMTSQESREHF